MFWLFGLLNAVAGTGPGVPGEGALHVYAGVDGQQFRQLKINGGPDGPFLFDVANGISGVGIVASATYGLSSNTEVELTVPFRHAHAKRSDGAVCDLLGGGACDTTNTLGVIEGRVKTLVLDEFSGRPLSFAVGATVRYGGFTAATRQRITNAGEGTLDVGARLSLGRQGSLGAGYWSALVDVEGFYRFPNTIQYPFLEGDLRAPAPEMSGVGQLLFTTKSWISLGPASVFLWRPGGVDFQNLLEESGADVDRFAALNVTDVRVGGKLSLSDSRFNSVTFAAYRTVYAKNNPVDTFQVSAGISLTQLLKNKESD